MEIRILGELEVLDGDARPLEITGPSQRALLATLATRPSKVISSEELIDALWGTDPPANASNALQTVVSRLRRAVGKERVLRRPPGYLLDVPGDAVDAVRFERLADDGRRTLAADPALAGEQLRQSLSLWRGVPLAELADGAFARFEVPRLEDRRLGALEDRIEADLASGRHTDVVEELGAVAAANPLRERLHAQHLRALYGAGRQAEALARYRAVAAALREEHGIEPGRALRDLERQMLRHDPALDPPGGPQAGHRPGRAKAGAPVLRLVSVVYIEVDEPTGAAGELDAERLRAAQARIFDEVSAAMERHGGVIERLPGDAAVSTFGFDRPHEDDAGRAVRAAASVAPAVARAVFSLGSDVDGPPAARVGVASGEVVAGHDSILGARVVRAARSLVRVAVPGDVLIDGRTVDLAPHGYEYEAVESGERPDLPRFRLRSAPPEEPPARPLGTASFVNREAEFRKLTGALDAAVATGRAQVVTVLGPAGIGKSRLLREFSAAIADRATVAGGRCLSYGQGTSVFALGGVVRNIVGDDVEAGLVRWLADVDRSDQIAARVAAAVGAGGEGGPVEEIQWAVRRLLERAARDRPLIVRLDDVHWGEPWLLDLVEYLAAFAAGSILVVTSARMDEMREARPEWTRQGMPGELLELEPLTATHTQELVVEMLTGRSPPPGAAEHIAGSSGGNPLFAEQFVALEVARGFVGESALPDSLFKLLEERIDLLEADEREVLARAAVEGVVFHRGALAALAEDAAPAKVGAAAMALMRKGFITTADPEVAGEDAFRFHHALLRNAAYEALPKERRARMHLRLAEWMERNAPESHEVIGHHLYEAWRFMGDLGADASGREEIGRRGAERLTHAGDLAVARSALLAAAELRRQAACILPERSLPRVRVLIELGDVLLASGRLKEAEQTLADAGELAEAIKDVGGAAHASVLGLQVALQADSQPPLDRIPDVTARAARTFRRQGDELGMCRVCHTRALADWFAVRCKAAGDAWEQAAEHARRSGDALALPDMLAWIASAALVGPEPVSVAIDRCSQVLEQMPNHPWWRAFAQRPLALLYALRGDFDQSRAVFAECRDVLDEMAETIHTAARDREAEAALLEGDAARAERLLRDSIERLRAMGDRFILSFSAGLLAQAVEAGGRADEAYELTLDAEGLVVEGDTLAAITWRVVRARILTGRARFNDAERLARHAITLAASTDCLVARGDAAATLGSVLRAQGRIEQADCALRDALRHYTEKEATVMAQACDALVR